LHKISNKIGKMMMMMMIQGCCHLSLSEVWGVHLLTPFFGLLGLGLHLGHLCGAALGHRRRHNENPTFGSDLGVI
jgi:hypothetical protein